MPTTESSTRSTVSSTSGRPAQLTPGDDQIVVIAMNVDGIVFEKADAYNVVIEIDGDEVKRLAIRVTLRPEIASGATPSASRCAA